MTHAEADSEGPPRWALIAALALAVGAIVAVLAVAANRRDAQGPMSVPAVPATHAADPACKAMMDVLPQRLGDYRRVRVTQPAPQGTAAWRAGDESVVLRCGLDRPTGFVVGSAIQIVDGVQWFAVRAEDRATWYAVDRPVYVALTLPPGSGPVPIQDLSDLIADAMVAVPINPSPAG